MNHAASADEQTPVPAGEPGPVMAGLAQRFFASFADCVVLVVLINASEAALNHIGPYFVRARNEYDTFPALLGLVLVNMAGCWLYAALLESSPWRATVGKLVTGLEVTDTSFNRISFMRASGRFLIKYLFFLVFYPLVIILLLAVHTGDEAEYAHYGDIAFVALALPLIDLAFAFKTAKCQSLHDLLAGTLVVQKASADNGGQARQGTL